MNGRQLCKIPEKTQKKIKGWSIICSLIWHMGISECVHQEAMSYQTQKAIHFCDFFRPDQTQSLKNKKSDHLKIIFDNILYF